MPAELQNIAVRGSRTFWFLLQCASIPVRHVQPRARHRGRIRAYQDLSGVEDADLDLPVLVEARKGYARLLWKQLPGLE